MSKRIGPITLDSEAADRITVITLKEQRQYLKKELAEFKKGKWLHHEDVVNNTRMIQSLDQVIKYFGG
jgi:tRNA G37 N-methylase Trm5